MTRQRTCEERLPEELAGRIADLRGLMEAASDPDNVSRTTLEQLDIDPEGDVTDQAYQRLSEYGLSVEKRVQYVWLISTGGPGDQFELTYDSEGDFVSAEYRFLDWFDGAVRALHGDEGEVVEQAFEMMYPVEV